MTWRNSSGHLNENAMETQSSSLPSTPMRDVPNTCLTAFMIKCYITKIWASSTLFHDRDFLRSQIRVQKQLKAAMLVAYCPPLNRCADQIAPWH